MKKVLQSILPSLVIFCAIACICAYLGYKQGYKCGQNYQDTVRVEVIDTIPYYKPVPVDSLVLRFETVEIPLYDDSLEIALNTVECDTAQNTISGIKTASDSVSIRIPITQKHYSDSTYEAWVSGWSPSLDSILVYRKTKYISTVIHKPPRRWSVGIQGGYGITPKGFQPYLGVGVQYRLY